MNVNPLFDYGESMSTTPRDTVDRIIRQWDAVRPDVDSSPIEVIGRVSRLSRLIDQHLAENFARYDLDDWMYDVVATLRRSGEPYQLTAGDLMRQCMVTTGAMTNRIDRLEQRGLVERVATDDRRKVIVQLTKRGLDTVDEVVVAHMATEREILSSLSTRQQHELANLLRTTLVALGDHGETPGLTSPRRSP